MTAREWRRRGGPESLRPSPTATNHAGPVGAKFVGDRREERMEQCQRLACKLRVGWHCVQPWPNPVLAIGRLLHYERLMHLSLAIPPACNLSNQHTGSPAHCFSAARHYCDLRCSGLPIATRKLAVLP